jgi:hypothetical protein
MATLSVCNVTNGCLAYHSIGVEDYSSMNFKIAWLESLEWYLTWQGGGGRPRKLHI